MDESNPDDEQLFLIPTRMKLKLPKTMSYPIGAESVSAALVDVPQRDLLKISFYFYSKSIKEHKQDHPFIIFEVNFTKFDKYLSASNAFIERGEYEEKWRLTVYPVPRQMKSTVKKLLLEKACHVSQSGLQWKERLHGKPDARASRFSLTRWKNQSAFKKTKVSPQLFFAFEPLWFL